jgi:hypothetical protein
MKRHEKQVWDSISLNKFSSWYFTEQIIQFLLFVVALWSLLALCCLSYLCTMPQLCQHNVGPSGVCALPLAAGRNEGGHFFRYWSERSACAALGYWHKRRWPLFMVFFLFFFSCSWYRCSKPQKGLS